MGTNRISHWVGGVAILLLASAAASCDRQGASPVALAPAAAPLIPRLYLFGDPARSTGQISPRGDQVAFLAPRDGVTNLWVLSVDAMEDARPLTDDRDRGVRAPLWARDNATLLYLKDEDGAESWRLFAVAAAGGAPRALTPAGQRAEVLGLSSSDLGGVVVALHSHEGGGPDVYRVDLATGARTLVFRNTGGFSRFVVDGENKLRLGMRRLESGDAELVVRTPEGGWRRLAAISMQDSLSSRPLAVEADGSVLMLDSTGRDRAALVRINMESGEKTVLGESARADVVDVWLNPTTRAPEAWAADYLRREWRGLEPDASADLDFLDQQLAGDFEVISRSIDDARWIVVEEGPATPPRSYLYDRNDRAARRLTLLFRHLPALEQAALQPMAPVEIEARDGLTLVSYLTLPVGSDANGDGRPEAPAPLVLAPHDGPYARESFGFNPLHQWLANRGYAVLSVNFRGSTGFGTAFLNAGNASWGGRIQDDLADAAQWAVDNGVAQADRIAILGTGFGGYAALSAAAFHADRYRCAASMGGPANLASFIESAPDSDDLAARAGGSDGSWQNLREQSPLFHAGRITRPIFLALGVRDPRVSRIETDLLAQNLRARGVNLTYIVFPDEGRELARQTNRGAYLAVLEHFLGDCLGGRVEPVGGAFEGASLQALDGAVNVPGLTAFARQPTPRVAATTRLATEQASVRARSEPQRPPPTAVPE